VVVQDVLFRTDNVLFRKEKILLPVAAHEPTLASLPPGYRGHSAQGSRA